MSNQKSVLLVSIDGIQERETEQVIVSARTSTKGACGNGDIGLIVLVGANTAPQDLPLISADQVITEIYEEVIESGTDELPPIVSVPGIHDAEPLPVHHLLGEALTRDWQATRLKIWDDNQDDLLELIQQRVFPRYTSWLRKLKNDNLHWHKGLLPGEGSTSIQIGLRTLGFTVINTVYRSSLNGLPNYETEIEQQQLKLATGHSWETWINKNDLSLVGVGISARHTPTMLTELPYTILISGHSDPPKRPGWLPVRGVSPIALRILPRKEGPLQVRQVTVDRQERPITWTSSSSDTFKDPSPSTEDAVTGNQFPDDSLDDFYRQLESGRMIAVSLSGVPNAHLTDLDALKRELARDIYGKVPVPEPSLGETWTAATASLNEQQIAHALRLLRAPKNVDYHALTRLLTGPWWRIYDFTASSAINDIASRERKKNIATIDATVEKPQDQLAQHQVTLLNGSFDGRISSVDFDFNLDDRSSSRTLWLNRLKTELLYHPVVIFANAIDSAILWETLALLDLPTSQLGPARFLVAPGDNPSIAARIDFNKFVHIPANPADFIEKRIQTAIVQVKRAAERRQRHVTADAAGTGVTLVSQLVEKAKPGSKAFLEGYEPEWGDILNGYAAELSISKKMIQRGAGLDESNKSKILILTGRAGSGKTTALMQTANNFNQAGYTAGWVDRSATHSLQRIRNSSVEYDLDAVFIDDVDIFGNQAPNLLRELNRGGKTLVVATIRTTKLDFLPKIFNADEISADAPLTDDDLRNLWKVLRKNGLLGILRGFRFSSPAKKVEELRKICDRSLLVAMIKVVTGQRFEDKIKDEFDGLDEDHAFAYATVCLLESAEMYKFRGISAVDFLQIVAEDRPRIRMQQAISKLVDNKLIVETTGGTLRCRHRAMADGVLHILTTERLPLLCRVMESLLLFYSAYAGGIKDSNNPYRRTMTRLLNHALMIELRLPDKQVRSIYDSVLPYLEDDFHYWLQRGEFELQRGNLSIASNYFESSRGCGGDGDYKVDTGWAAVMLRASTADPESHDKLLTAFEALRTLDHVCYVRGKNSEHSFVVMIRNGTEWLEKVYAFLQEDDFQAAYMATRNMIELGRKLKLESIQFDKAAREYEPRLIRLLEKTRGVPT